MVAIRRSEERGQADHGWLRSQHTFSFADYHDPAQMGFRALRVINEDRVAPGRGFPKHGHRDMEIISYVLEGELAHEDSMGTGSVIRPHDVQRMSAGRGVTHSEHNPSATQPVHFLQIWIEPDRKGLEPSYAQTHVPPEDKRGRLRLIASPDGADGALTIRQDARVYATLLGEGQRVTHALGDGRYGYVHVVRGELGLGDAKLRAGDGARLSGATSIELVGAGGDAEALVFDLP